MDGMGLGHSIAALILAVLTDDWRAGWHVLLWNGMTRPCGDGESISSIGALGDRLWHTSSGELGRMGPSLSAWP